MDSSRTKYYSITNIRSVSDNNKRFKREKLYWDRHKERQHKTYKTNVNDIKNKHVSTKLNI
jgi:hypothetical protein